MEGLKTKNFSYSQLLCILAFAVYFALSVCFFVLYPISIAIYATIPIAVAAWVLTPGYAFGTYLIVVAFNLIVFIKTGDFTTNSIVGEILADFFGILAFFMVSQISLQKRKLKEANLEIEKTKEELKYKEVVTGQYIDLSSNLIAVLDCAGVIILINKRGEEVLEMPKSKLIGKSWFDFVPKKDQKKVKAAFERLMADKEKLDYIEHLLVTKNKERLYGFYNNFLADNNGVVYAIAISGEDVTERYLYEKEIKEKYAELEKINKLIKREKEKSEDLAENLKKFQLAVENASDQIVITDHGGIILYANKAVEKATGFKLNETIGKKAGSRELWGGLMPKKFYQKLWETVIKDKKVFYGEVLNKRKNDNPYEASLSISPILNKKKEVIFLIGILRDITIEKEINKAKTEFVSLASHQLRTPLSSIAWYAEMLIAGDAGRLNEKQKVFLNEIYRGNKRMINLVNALLNVSRIDLGTFQVNPKMVNVEKIMEQNIKQLALQIKNKKIKLIKDFQKNIPKIKLDLKLMEIVLQNLLTNAINYTPKEGEVKITIKMEKEKKGKHLKIEVSDNGCGIPERQKDKVFTKLFRADNVKTLDSEGTGLGLYIVKSIIDATGGKILFESTEGKGTKFSVLIPGTGMRAKKGTKTLDYKAKENI